jgi:hypothetical protein
VNFVGNIDTKINLVLYPCNSAKKKFALKREKEIEEALERIDVYNQVFLTQ